MRISMHAASSALPPAGPPQPPSQERATHPRPEVCAAFRRRMAACTRLMEQLRPQLDHELRHLVAAQRRGDVRSYQVLTARAERTHLQMVNLRGDANGFFEAWAIACSGCAPSVRSLHARGGWPFPEVWLLSDYRLAYEEGQEPLADPARAAPKAASTATRSRRAHLQLVPSSPDPRPRPPAWSSPEAARPRPAS